MTRLNRRLPAAIAALALLASPAAAVPLGPGGFAAPTGRSVAGSPELAGTVIYDEYRTDFVQVNGPEDDVTLGYSVGIQTRVVRSDLDGTLDFYLRLINEDTFTYPVFNIDDLGFTGFDLDADFRTDGLGTLDPVSVAREFDSGNGVRFSFGTGIVPPADGGSPGSTRFLLIDTLATAFDLTGRVLLQGGLDSADPTIRELSGTPRPVVPEPASVLIAAAGALALLRRR